MKIFIDTEKLHNDDNVSDFLGGYTFSWDWEKPLHLQSDKVKEFLINLIVKK
jgi:hypothetical protein